MTEDEEQSIIICFAQLAAFFEKKFITNKMNKLFQNSGQMIFFY